MESYTVGGPTRQVTWNLPSPFRVPCGLEFADEIQASEHYMACPECDRIHKARDFRATP